MGDAGDTSCVLPETGGGGAGWTPGSGVDVELLDPVHGIVAEDSFATGVVAAVEWLRDIAYDHYRDTAFAEGSDPLDPVAASP